MSELLATYLVDHHAGSSAGVDAFHRVAEGHGDAAVREAVARLAGDVEADQEALEAVMDAVGASPSTLKDTAASLGEKVGRLKPNQRLVERSPLSDLVELESLVAAVHAKGLLWKALVALDDPRIDRSAVERLAARADAQHDELERLRLSQVAKLHQS